MYRVRTKVGRSTIPGAGIGLFAAEPIPKGHVVWEVSPWHAEFDHEDMDKLPESAREVILFFGYFDQGGNCYCLDIDNGRFTNHSDDANLKVIDPKRRECLQAVRDIAAGEELTIDYRAVDAMAFRPELRRGYPHRDFLDTDQSSIPPEHDGDR